MSGEQNPPRPPSSTEVVEPEGSRDPTPDGGSSSPEPFEMGGVAKHAVIYGLGTILSRAISFIMLPVYTRYLTPADYGVMGLIEMTLDVISIAAGAQLALAIFRFYHKTDDPVEKKAVVSTALIGLGVSYGLVGLGCFLAAGPISELLFSSREHVTLIRVASVSLAFQSLVIVPLSYARVKERSGLFVTANFVKLLIGLSLNIALVVFAGLGVLGVFISSLVANLVTGIWMTGWATSEVGIRFSRSATRNLLRYGIPMVGMQFATFVATFGDRYFLQAVAGEETVGLYHLAYQFGFILAMLGAMPFEQIWAPKRFEVAKREDRDRIYADAFVYSNIWLVTLAVGMVLFVGDVFEVMTQPSFYAAAPLVPLILVAYIFQAWASIQDIGILVEERTEYLTLANWIAAAVAVVSYALLIPRYLGFGAAIGTVLSFGARWALTYRYSQKLWRVDYRWVPVIRLCLISLVVCLVGLALPELHVGLSLAVHSLLFGGYVFAVWHMGILTREEKATALRLIRRGVATARTLRSEWLNAGSSSEA